MVTAVAILIVGAQYQLKSMAALCWEYLYGSMTTSWQFAEGLLVPDMYAHAEKTVRIQYQGSFQL